MLRGRSRAPGAILYVCCLRRSDGNLSFCAQLKRPDSTIIPPKIDLIRKWEVGTNIGASSRPYDLVVYSTFDTLEDVAAFRSNPDHVEVATYVRQFVEVSGTVDYDNEA